MTVKPHANLSIRVRLTERRRAKLDAYAKETEKTISQLINDFIDSLPEADKKKRQTA